MKMRTLKRDYLRRASSVLVFSPHNASGTRAFMELLSAGRSSRTDMAVITYTQTPDMWISEWFSGPLPAGLTFIHDDPKTEQEHAQERDVDIETVRVSPDDPMDAIAALSTALKRWQGSENRTVVSVQSLTVLLEYVEFETAFRYLHILIHRIQAVDAIGFFQIDPRDHNEEDVDTLRALFDMVIETTDNEDETYSFEVTSDRRERRGVEGTVVEHDPSNRDRSNDEIDGESDGESQSLLSALKTHLPGLKSRNRAKDASNRVADEETSSALEGGAPSDRNGSADRETDELLTDEERIKKLLHRFDGRMRQTDIASNSKWSSSTVSRKLSKMEEDGQIKRVQVGRGNVVFLPGYEPDATASPFER